MITLFRLPSPRPRPGYHPSHRLLVLACMLFASLGAQAQTTQPAELVELTQRWVDKALLQLAATSPQPLRLEASVGEPDSRLQLARCQRAEPYLPAGTRLWGKTRLGVRCVDGPVKWNVFLPISIKAWGPAWVIKGQVASGTMIGADDAMEAEVDWAEEPSPVITSAPAG